MIQPDISLVMILVIAVCEAALLTFLYFISRFYALKFGQKTFHNVFLATAAAVVALALASILFYAYAYYAVTLANLLAMAVLLVFGLRLFRLMTGVTK